MEVHPERSARSGRVLERAQGERGTGTTRVRESPLYRAELAYRLDLGGEGGLLQRDAVHHVEVGARRPLDDVGGERPAAVDASGVLDLQDHLALRVLADRDALDLVVAQLAGDTGDALDGLEDGVDRAVAAAGLLVARAVLLLQRDGGRGERAGAARGREGHELPGVLAGGEDLAVD